MRKRSAFTLLELLAVLFVMSILLLVCGWRLSSALIDARNARIESDLDVLVAACEQYVQRCPDTVAGTQDELMAEGVLADMVESPVAGYAYVVQAREGQASAALMKGGEVYEEGTFRAEKYSKRLYLD